MAARSVCITSNRRSARRIGQLATDIRLGEGGGIAWIARFRPPEGKLIKIVANALSDEHILNLEGGRGTKSGTPVRAASGYGLNTTGQPHSAFIGVETTSFILYTGEPDEIVSLEVVDPV